MRTRKIAAIVAAWVIGLPILLVLLVLAAANTSPGQRLIERETASLTHGQIRLAGLAGRLPDAARLRRLTIADAHGVWLTVDDARLIWSPWALLGGQARVRSLTASRVAMDRLPAPGAPSKPSGGFDLPVRVRVDALKVDRIELGTPVAGAFAALRLTGNADIASPSRGTAQLALDRLDSPGTYRLDATVNANTIQAALTAAEPPHGLISSALHLPDLGALTVDAGITGPRRAEALQLYVGAGQIVVSGGGFLDLVGNRGSVDLTGAAPAMTPGPGVSWARLGFDAHVHGAFAKPDLAAHVTVQDFRGGGAGAQSLTADLTGTQGAVDLHAMLLGTRIAGPSPDLFAAPLDLQAHAQLDQASRPVTFKLTDPVVNADGQATTAGNIVAHIHLAIPSLAPIAAIGHVDLQGRSEAVADFAVHGQMTSIKLDGTASITGGVAPVPGLLGDARFGVTAELMGQDIAIQRAVVDGRAVRASVTGADRAGALDLAFKLGLSDLSRLNARAQGAVEATGTVTGGPGGPDGTAIAADVTGQAGTVGFPRGPVTLTLRAQGVPARPAGTLLAHALFEGSPLDLDAAVQRGDAGTHIVLRNLDWRSLRAAADANLAQGATLPQGKLTLRMTRLADLAGLVGQPVAGSLTASVRSAGARVLVDAQGTTLALGVNQIGRLAVTGSVDDPVHKPALALTVAADAIAAGGVTGNARVQLVGPQDALGIAGTALLHQGGADANLTLAALLNAGAKTLRVARLDADYKGEALQLQAPATVSFGEGVAVDRLRLGLGPAVLQLAGKLSPALDLTASLRNVTPDLARPFAPNLDLAGVLSADAHLTGTPAAPAGRISLAARGVRMRHGPGSGVPAATLAATAQLAAGSAAVDTHLTAGPDVDLRVTGTVPFGAGPLGAGPLALRGSGRVDLAVLDPVLLASGRRARGRMSVDGTVGGTARAPLVAGTATLAGGEIQDFGQGVHITAIAARLQAAGDTVRIVQFSGTAGPGTIAVAGSVGVAAPQPVDLRITASNARPLASDLLTATMDADIALRGQVQGDLAATGTVRIRRADINLPASLPPSVAVLNVRRPGDKPPPVRAAAPPAALIRLALLLDAPRNVFVRGHGLDSELGGAIHIAGNTAAPQVSGAFDLRRGTFDLAGTTLNFSKGTVGFDGTGVANKIDPTLDFEADSVSGGITAMLKITGYADAPKIALSSSPDLPQDEVLAHLLFGTSVKNLTVLQLAQIGSAVASLGSGGGGGALDFVRNNLGLDRLAVGGGTNGAGASVEAGRYVARGVYVGAKQATSGGGTQAQVQVDLTRHLKLTTQLGTGGGTVQGATPENDPGSSVGLSYQFEY